MSDKRKVSTDALETLGTIITSGERDAIHLAVEPVIAGEFLKVGQDIGIGKDGKAYSIKSIIGKYLGIVDPFLKSPVKVGEKFWLIVYPRQITSLRHVWSHPDFPESVLTENITNEKEASIKWMTNWARVHMSEDYYGDEGRLSDETAYSKAIEAGHNNHIGPYEDATDYIDDTWWDHWETITGQRGDRGSYFSCSC